MGSVLDKLKPGTSEYDRTVKKRRKIYTDVFVIDQPTRRLLLGQRKRSFGVGLFDGYGGKLDPGETILEAAQREVREECGLKLNLSDLEFVGQVDYERKDELMENHIFKCTKFEGVPKETREMRPRWFGFDDLPYDQMWPDFKYWFPKYLLQSEGDEDVTKVLPFYCLAVAAVGNESKELQSITIYDGFRPNDKILVEGDYKEKEPVLRINF